MADGIVDVTAQVHKIDREHMNHISELQAQWCKQMTDKYRRGVIEHGGKLWLHEDLWLLDEAIQENIDQFVYLFTLRQNMAKKLIKKETGEDNG